MLFQRLLPNPFNCCALARLFTSSIVRRHPPPLIFPLHAPCQGLHSRGTEVSPFQGLEIIHSVPTGFRSTQETAQHVPHPRLVADRHPGGRASGREHAPSRTRVQPMGSLVKKHLWAQGWGRTLRKTWPACQPATQHGWYWATGLFGFGLTTEML